MAYLCMFTDSRLVPLEIFVRKLWRKPRLWCHPSLLVACIVNILLQDGCHRTHCNTCIACFNCTQKKGRLDEQEIEQMLLDLARIKKFE